MPKRRTLVGTPARQQQCAPCGFAKPPGKERGRAKLAQNHLHGFGRFDEDPVRIGWFVGIGKAKNKTIVAPEGFHFRTAGGADACADRHGPGNVDAAAERRQNADAPVAEFVASPFNHNRPIVGDLAGRGFLISEELQQVFGGSGIEVVLSDKAGERGRLGQGAKFADQGTDAAAKLQRTTRAVALPEGHLARLAWSGNNKDTIVGDVFDAPGGGTEDKRLVGMRLEDHLFVEFADADGLAFGVGEKDAVESAVGNGSGVEDGEAACAFASRHDVANAIPGEARPQFGKLIGGIAAAQKIENAIEGRAGEGAKRRSAAHKIVESVDVHLRLRLLFRWVRAFPGLEIQRRT